MHLERPISVADLPPLALIVPAFEADAANATTMADVPFCASSTSAVTSARRASTVSFDEVGSSARRMSAIISNGASSERRARVSANDVRLRGRLRERAASRHVMRIARDMVGSFVGGGFVLGRR
jgi:hypothetical protein